MTLLRILLVLAAAALPLPAQTNAPSKVRELSLQDGIQLALQNNLDLQIDRYDASLPLFTLAVDYGGYDPSLTLSGTHDHSLQGNRLLSGGFVIAGATSDDNTFSGALSGLLPWGTTYSVQANATDTYGSTPGSIPDLKDRPVSVTTNYALTSSGIVAIGTTTNHAQFPFGSSPFENSIGSASIRVTQPLLKNFWIDSTRLSIQLDKNRIKYSEQTLRLQIMQIITKLEQAYYDLIYDRENVIVQQKAVELAQRLVAENKKKVEVGALAPLDEKQAESQAATSEAALIAARSTLAVQEAVIKSFITRQYSGWAEVAPVPTGTLEAPLQLFNLQDSWDKGLRKRPEILQAKLDLEHAGIQLKYDHNQLFPELDVAGTYGYNGSGREFSGVLGDIENRDRPFYSFGGTLTLPLANVKARNIYRSDKVVMEEAVIKVKKIERDIMQAIDTDIHLAQSGYEQVGATRAAREYAEAALDAEQKKLESGKSTVYTVLQMQRDLTTARGNEIQALDNYNKNLSQLSQDEGTTLERLKIRFSIK